MFSFRVAGRLHRRSPPTSSGRRWSHQQPGRYIRTRTATKHCRARPKPSGHPPQPCRPTSAHIFERRGCPSKGNEIRANGRRSPLSRKPTTNKIMIVMGFLLFRGGSILEFIEIGFLQSFLIRGLFFCRWTHKVFKNGFD